jgi:hypothetical protein
LLIEGELKERAANNSICDKLADEARWLYEWAQQNYANISGVPSTPKVVENQIRTTFNRLKTGRYSSITSSH